MITVFCSPCGRYVELQASTAKEMAELQKVVDCRLGTKVEEKPGWMRVQISVEQGKTAEA